MNLFRRDLVLTYLKGRNSIDSQTGVARGTYGLDLYIGYMYRQCTYYVTSEQQQNKVFLAPWIAPLYR